MKTARPLSKVIATALAEALEAWGGKPVSLEQDELIQAAKRRALFAFRHCLHNDRYPAPFVDALDRALSAASRMGYVADSMRRTGIPMFVPSPPPPWLRVPRAPAAIVLLQLLGEIIHVDLAPFEATWSLGNQDALLALVLASFPANSPPKARLNPVKRSNQPNGSGRRVCICGEAHAGAHPAPLTARSQPTARTARSHPGPSASHGPHRDFGCEDPTEDPPRTARRGARQIEARRVVSKHARWWLGANYAESLR